MRTGAVHAHRKCLVYLASASASSDSRAASPAQVRAKRRTPRRNGRLDGDASRPGNLMSARGFLGLVVLCCDWPLQLRRKIACACAVSFRWLRLSFADRDLASQDLSLVVLPSMRLTRLPRARRERASRRDETRREKTQP